MAILIVSYLKVVIWQHVHEMIKLWGDALGLSTEFLSHDAKYHILYDDYDKLYKNKYGFDTYHPLPRDIVPFIRKVRVLEIEPNN